MKNYSLNNCVFKTFLIYTIALNSVKAFNYLSIVNGTTINIWLINQQIIFKFDILNKRFKIWFIIINNFYIITNILSIIMSTFKNYSKLYNNYLFIYKFKFSHKREMVKKKNLEK